MFSVKPDIGCSPKQLLQRICTAFFFALVSCVAFQSPAAAQTSEEVNYTVKPGDTLNTLASTYFINAKAVAVVQRVNHISNPNLIRVGSILRIPRNTLRFTETQGTLVAWRGAVQIWVKGAATAPQKNQSIAETMIIETGAVGSAVIALANGSRISIPSQSRIQMLRLRQYTLGGSIDYDLAVLKGRMETQAAKLDAGDSRYRVRTPSAVTAVRGTEFRVKYSGDDATAGASATEVSEGQVGVDIASRLAPEGLAKGEALALAVDGSVKRGNLIAAPTLAAGSRIQTAADIRIAITPMPDAVRYFGNISRDASGTEVISSANSAENSATLAFEPLDDGTYYVRLSAENADGFEGFARTYQLIRAQTGLSSSANRAADGRIKFAWLPTGNKDALYRFQLRAKNSAAPPLVDNIGLRSNSIELAKLPPGTWVWRVAISRVVDGTRIEYWTTPEELVIGEETAVGAK
jgi:hypothetical protein